MTEEIAQAAPAATPAASPATPAIENPTLPTESAPAAATPIPADSSTAAADAGASGADTASPEAKPAEADTSLLKPELAEEKPAEQPKEGEAKPEEAKPDGEDATLPEPAYEPFTVPEGISFDNERMADFTKTLGEFEKASNASHEEVQKLGQSLVERHIAEVQTALERQRDSFIQQWNAKKAEDVANFKADPEYGGNRMETSLREANGFIRDHGGKAEDVAQLYKDLDETGMSAKPSMVRFLLNIKNGATFREPQPLAAPQIAKALPVSRIQKMYGKKSG